jgi:bacterioferritin-associated ferredoxin
VSGPLEGRRGRVPPEAARAAARAALERVDRELLVCRCEEITVGEVLEAVADGITSPDGLKRRLRIGMGLCQGRTCRHLLARTLARHAGLALDDIDPATFRPPVRPLPAAALLDEREPPVGR